MNSRALYGIFLAAVISMAAASCTDKVPEAGVPKVLADHRSATVSDVKYSLHFDIPSCRDSSISASETITLTLAGRDGIWLDMKGFEVHALSVNGIVTTPEIVNEHLRIPRRLSHKGVNTVELSFTAGEQSLNRRDRFLYTLLVPDRARTLFPCFDQPDMKARYTLSLSIPDGWVAVSNTAVDSTKGHTVQFRETEPLSTYLFSFVAGEFECVTAEGVEAAGHPIHLYHRETDPARVAQCGDVLRLVRNSLDWLEDYTGIDYPFAKYDLVVLPDFQYGGMEHTGATLYNDRRIFLSGAPTTEEILGRASLIAHETAHMWFGDLVTMKWFDDVWTKEVFANFFAAKMVRPMFPEVNHALNDLMTLNSPAYSEDRTIGSNAVQRPLDNLNNAGLIYCNIIYDKSPVVMAMLERRLGEDAFRSGIHDYLEKYSYSNATWDDLISILDGKASFDVQEWSRVWIKEKGMPVFKTGIEGARVTVTQSDPFGQGNTWQEDIKYFLTGRDSTVLMKAVFDGDTTAVLEAPFEVLKAVPDVDGLSYGRFITDDLEGLEALYPLLDATARMSVLMSIYENAWHGDVDARGFLEWICCSLKDEPDNLIRSTMMGYAGATARWCGDTAGLEHLLRSIAADVSENHEFRLLAFRSLVSLSSLYDDELYDIWHESAPYAGLSLGESDYTSMAYQLMLRFPQRAQSIREMQLERISNPDRKASFEYVAQACSASQEERDAFFRSLLSADTRGPEARVTQALKLLNSPLREKESIRYIRPALDSLPAIQRTGDIFFPANWCSALLSGHYSPEAAAEVRAYVDSADINPLLMTKVLQRGGWLLR